MANLILWLASGETSYVSGSKYITDGGAWPTAESKPAGKDRGQNGKIDRDNQPCGSGLWVWPGCVLYGPDAVARRGALTEQETAILHAAVLALLAERPVSVQPKDIPAKRSRLETRICADG